MCQGATDFEQVATATGADRRRTGGRRSQVQMLLNLAQHLPKGDQVLLRQVFDLGISPGQIAQAARCNRHSIYRRIRSLLRRLNDPLFGFAVAHFETFDRTTRAVARAIVLHGLTQRQAARTTGLTVHLIRQHLQSLRTLAARQALIGLNRF